LLIGQVQKHAILRSRTDAGISDHDRLELKRFFSQWQVGAGDDPLPMIVYYHYLTRMARQAQIIADGPLRGNPVELIKFSRNFIEKISLDTLLAHFLTAI
jgi:hypothetical protein